MKVLNEHLEHFVTQKLMVDPDFSSANIDVLAKDGKVKLTGTVSSFRRKLKAVSIAAECDGVSSVDNLLKVDSESNRSDRKIAAAIDDSLVLESGICQQVIRVDVRNGCVCVSGYVSSDQEKRLVEDAILGVRGVREVENMLLVNRNKVLANDEHCNAIRASLSRIIGMTDLDLKVTVIDETAQISGKVGRLWQKEAAETTVRRFGILNVCNDIYVE